MSARPPIVYGFTSTPIGKTLLVGSGSALTGLYMADHAHTPAAAERWLPDRGELDDVRRQLDEYFTGARTGFDLIARPAGTPFQLAVWSILEAIPYGTTITYGEIAGRLGRPSAARAVGAANGQNPISIVIPCHRVIGSSGGLTGYGWGLERKAWLLRHEREHSELTGS
jgi:methylated-DNA-[protein]-cysteine S-methyltransferase